MRRLVAQRIAEGPNRFEPASVSKCVQPEDCTGDAVKKTFKLYYNTVPGSLGSTTRLIT